MTVPILVCHWYIHNCMLWSKLMQLHMATFSSWLIDFDRQKLDESCTITGPPFDNLTPSSLLNRSLYSLGLELVRDSCQMYLDVFRNHFESKIWSSHWVVDDCQKVVPSFDRIFQHCLQRWQRISMIGLHSHVQSKMFVYLRPLGSHSWVHYTIVKRWAGDSRLSWSTNKRSLMQCHCGCPEFRCILRWTRQQRPEMPTSRRVPTCFDNLKSLKQSLQSLARYFMAGSRHQYRKGAPCAALRLWHL